MDIKKIFTVIFVFYSVTLWAHPHVFVDSRVKITMNEDSIEYIDVEWEFDRMFSSTIINEFDKNKNGTIDGAEVMAVKKGAFDNLRDYGYMCKLVLNGKRMKIKQITSFKTKYKNRKIFYLFRIPINRKINNTGKVILAIYDRTSFCDFQLFKTRPLEIVHPENIRVESEIKRVSYKLEYVTPQEIRLNYKKL